MVEKKHSKKKKHTVKGSRHAGLEPSSVRATADGGAELAGDPKINIFTE